MLCIYMGMIDIIDCHFFFFHNEHENIIYVFLKHLCNFQPNNNKRFLVYNVCCKDFVHNERKVQCRRSIEMDRKV